MKKVFLTLSLILVASSSWAEDRFITHVTLTTYNAVRSQCDDDPLTTADGTRIDPHKVKSGKQRIVAISRDLLWAIPLGSTIYIEGHGTYQVRDTMADRFDHCIDILQHSSQPDFRKEKIQVTLKSKPNKK